MFKPVKSKKSIVKARLKALSGLADKCLQCGLCSSICPPTRFQGKGFNIRKLSLKILRGKTGKGNSLSEIWSCFTCFDCWKLCPHQVNLPQAIVQLRETLADAGLAGKLYPAVRPYLDNMAEAGRIAAVANVWLRKQYGLAEDPSIPREALGKVKALMEASGFLAEVERFRKLYGV